MSAGDVSPAFGSEDDIKKPGGCIYAIWSIANPDGVGLYVGRTAYPAVRRFAEHLNMCRKGKHNCRMLREYKAFGEETFVLRVLEFCSPNEGAADREQEWLRRLFEGDLAKKYRRLNVNARASSFDEDILRRVGREAVTSGQLARMSALPQTIEAHRRVGRRNVESGHWAWVNSLPQTQKAKRKASQENGRIAGQRSVENGQLEWMRSLPQTKDAQRRFALARKESGYIQALGRKYGPINGQIQGRKMAENGELERIRSLPQSRAARLMVGLRNVETGQVVELGKKQGRINVENGHLERIRSREASVRGGKAAGAIMAESGRIQAFGRIQGRKNVESGHLLSICRAGGIASAKAGQCARMSPLGIEARWSRVYAHEDRILFEAGIWVGPAHFGLGRKNDKAQRVTVKPGQIWQRKVDLRRIKVLSVDESQGCAIALAEISQRVSRPQIKETKFGRVVSRHVLVQDVADA